MPENRTVRAGELNALEEAQLELSRLNRSFGEQDMCTDLPCEVWRPFAVLNMPNDVVSRGRLAVEAWLSKFGIRVVG